MAAPSTPTGFTLQQGNGQALLTWDSAATATSYKVYRSTDGVIFSNTASPVALLYLDITVTAGTLYYYYVIATNIDGDSAATSTLSTTPLLTGQMSLADIRLLAQQKADMVNSNFVTETEWNTYINQSAFELYDLLTTLYEDYYVAAPVTFQTTNAQQYSLTTVFPNFYKLVGVDCGLSLNSNAWVSLKKFDFISRNRYVYPQLTSTFMGVFNLRYRLVGSTLMFIPTPSAGQYIRIWAIPRMPTLLQDSDVLDGINGWDEYVAVDAAIKALIKEESTDEASALMQQKMMLKARIEESGMNRDAGAPDTISDTRGFTERWGGGEGGPMGGY